jgi:hypothetical protein
MIDRLILLTTERAFGGVLQAVPHPAVQSVVVLILRLVN